MRFDRLAQLLIQHNLLALYRKESCLSFSLYLVRAFFLSVLKTFLHKKVNGLMSYPIPNLKLSHDIGMKSAISYRVSK